MAGPASAAAVSVPGGFAPGPAALSPPTSQPTPLLATIWGAVITDPKQVEIFIGHLDSNGTRLSNGSIRIKQSDVNGVDCWMQEWDVCVPDGAGGFIAKKAMFLSSAPY